MIRSILIRHLNDLGFHDVSEAADGQMAWSLMNQSQSAGMPYGIVFLDWNMPRMTGIELIERCRGSANFAHVPIVLVTAEREKTSVLRALQAGASDYIMKPISASVLSAKMGNIVERARQKAA